MGIFHFRSADISMCGIAGVHAPTGVTPADLQAVAAISALLAHRGPDDEGLHQDDACVLGHRRLAIIDLSQDGHQPFASADGRLWMVYNGEIYNYRELRHELEGRGHHFQTRTDTEVLLVAFQEWGPACLPRLNGMFAFAVYDRTDNNLFLARDRIGIKPLYYRLDGERMWFASELKALVPILPQRREIDSQALFDYLVFNRTDLFDETFLAEVRRLPKGHYVLRRGESLSIRRWWNPEDYLGGQAGIGMAEANKRVAELFLDSVRLRMRSDVSVGSTLSGGLDSSIILGALYDQELATAGYPAFTAEFPGEPMDEGRYVDALNRRYPFAGHRVRPTADACLAELAEFVYSSDEPTTNPSAYCQHAVMRLAQQKGVTVLLDGQGGDEGFAGYPYFHGFHLDGLLHQRHWWAVGNELLHLLRGRHPGAFQTLLFQRLPESAQTQLLARRSPWLEPEFFAARLKSSRVYNGFFDAPDLETSQARHFQYKLEHLLRMEDRNSMAFSIEARLPYLDYRLVEYLLGLPARLKLGAGETKRLQRQALGNYTVPEILTRTEKIGFAPPTGAWLRQSVWQDLAEACFAGLKRAYGEVFRTSAPLPTSPELRWKLIQLGLWRERFL